MGLIRKSPAKLEARARTLRTKADRLDALAKRRRQQAAIKAKLKVRKKTKGKPGQAIVGGQTTALSPAKTPTFASFLIKLSRNTKYKKRNGSYKLKPVKIAITKRLITLGVADPSKLVDSIMENVEKGHSLVKIAGVINPKK